LSRASSIEPVTVEEVTTEQAASEGSPAGLVDELLREPAPPLAASPPPVAVPALATARIDGERIRLAIGSQVVLATRDPGLHPAVLAGAAARGERVLAERDDAGKWTVVGALRTQPTPGLEPAAEYTIEADRVTIKAKQEISLVAEVAGIAVRAAGEVESYAERIVSRAEGLHKIVGRILRLN
jgi:hypothetical protein